MASRQLLYVPICDGHTLFHDFYEPYYFTKVRCEKRPPGYGLRCHRIIALLCKLIGIKDMYAKIDGAVNPQNITKAFIRGLLKQVKEVFFLFEKLLKKTEILLFRKLIKIGQMLNNYI